jgi:hypothetical protein
MSLAPDRHRRLRAVFDDALLQAPSAREAYVDLACASDPELKHEVMRLLAAHQRARAFLEHPPELLLSAVRAEEEFSGTGRFQVVQRLGAGGMGVVYEVHDRCRPAGKSVLPHSWGSDSFSLQAEGRDGSKSLSVKGLPVCDSKSRSVSNRRRQPPRSETATHCQTWSWP